MKKIIIIQLRLKNIGGFIMEEMRLVEQSEKYNYRVYENSKYKEFKSPKANYVFDKISGRMYSWGERTMDDPKEFPSPNILDIEVSTICTKGCSFCYKANIPQGHNMSYEEFTKMIDILPKSITQIAFGSGYFGTENPDIYRMMDYSRKKGIIPNITVGYVSEESADEFAKRVGAIAISRYEPKDNCYNSVKRMTDRGISQTNIHYMICEETYEGAIQTIRDAKSDPRLEKLNAIVFLSLKTKGRGETGFTPLSIDKFKNLCSLATELGVGIGFDSCSSLKAFESFDGDEKIAQMIEPCESGIISFYISSYGKGYPCSFAEGYNHNGIDWTEGVDVFSCTSSEDFLDKVWNNKRIVEFKKMLHDSTKCNGYNCRTCPLYTI